MSWVSKMLSIQSTSLEKKFLFFFLSGKKDLSVVITWATPTPPPLKKGPHRLFKLFGMFHSTMMNTEFAIVYSMPYVNICYFSLLCYNVQA